MKEYHAADIRNFAIVGHASSGKTMLSEAMLVRVAYAYEQATAWRKRHPAALT